MEKIKIEEDIRNLIFHACRKHDDTGESSYDMEARRIVKALEEGGFKIVKIDCV